MTATLRAVSHLPAGHGGHNHALLAGLTAAVHSQVPVAVRLAPLGQTEGPRVMAALEPRIAGLARDAAIATLDDPGGIACAAGIARVRHESLEPRLFRS